jgi:hypothetical protein
VFSFFDKKKARGAVGGHPRAAKAAKNILSERGALKDSK